MLKVWCRNYRENNSQLYYEGSGGEEIGRRGKTEDHAHFIGHGSQEQKGLFAIRVQFQFYFRGAYASNEGHQ